MKRKLILFISGTRADFGKLKPLINAVKAEKGFTYSVFVTGMHMIARYGYTVNEFKKSKIRNIHMFENQFVGEPMSLVLANTIGGLYRFIHEKRPDMIVVHGDRSEALAGAVVGILNNILVAHVEGGEISGTVDELVRHSVSKLSHLHFVANREAAVRLEQMGESPESIFVIGSPDIDVMGSSNLPDINAVLKHYRIKFKDYAVAMFHPITTEPKDLSSQVDQFVTAMRESGRNYVVIYPNNDEGTETIFNAYKPLRRNKQFHLVPSMRFENFLVLLKHADFLIGNSSAGIREAPVYAVPTINLGSRQNRRFEHVSIHSVPCEKKKILTTIDSVLSGPKPPPSNHFGEGDSDRKFMDVLIKESTWSISPQKQFRDIPLAHSSF